MGFPNSLGKNVVEDWGKCIGLESPKCSKIGRDD